MRGEELFGLWETKLREGKYLLLNPLLGLQLSTQAYLLPRGVCALCSSSHQICTHEAPLDFTYHYEDSDFLLQVGRTPAGLYHGSLLNRDNGRRRPCHLRPFLSLPSTAPCPFCPSAAAAADQPKRRRRESRPKAPTPPGTHLGYCVCWIARTTSGFDVIDDDQIEPAFRRFVVAAKGHMKARVEDPGHELERILLQCASAARTQDFDEAKIYFSNFGQVNFDDFSLTSSDVRATGTDVVYRLSFALHRISPGQDPVDLPCGEDLSARIMPLDFPGEEAAHLVISLIHHNPRSALPPFAVVACRGRGVVTEEKEPCCASCVNLCDKERSIICGSYYYRRARKDPDEVLKLMRSLYRPVQSSITRRRGSLGGRRNSIDEDDDDVCVICLDSLKRRGVAGLPNCRHTFHNECVDEYVKRVASGVIDCVRCPVCHVMQTRVYGNSPKAFMCWSGNLTAGWRLGISVLPGVQKAHLHPRPGEKHKPWLTMFLLPPGQTGLDAFAQIKKAFVLGQLLEVKDVGNAVGFAYGLKFATRPADHIEQLTEACQHKLKSIGIEATVEESTKKGPGLAQQLHQIARTHSKTDDEDDDEEEVADDEEVYSAADDDDEDDDNSDDDESPVDYDADDVSSEADWRDIRS